METSSIEISQGDILFAQNNKNKHGIRSHYIIFLGPKSQELFFGAMLTSSSGYNNIPLTQSHFQTHDSTGKKFKVQYKSSYISSRLYHKKTDWAPFIKVGELSQQGLDFIKQQIGNKQPIDFPHNK